MTNQERHSKLGAEDLKRVEQYLSTSIHQVERKPFRPLLLLFWIWVVVAGLGVISWLFGRLAGLL